MDEFEPETRGEIGLLREGVGGSAICSVHPVTWFPPFRAVPQEVCWGGTGLPPSSHHLLFTAFAASPRHLSASLCFYYNSSVTPSPLCQTCRLAGVWCDIISKIGSPNDLTSGAGTPASTLPLLCSIRTG